MSVPTATSGGVAEQFDRDGYVIFRNVIDRELVEEARAHVDWLQRQHPDLRPEELGHTLVGADPFWVRLVSDERILDVAEQFIGPDIALFASHYICKPPHDGQPVLWHQDASYWPLEPMEVVSVWLAVDDATTENGCLRVIPSTHQQEVQSLRAATDRDNVLHSEIDADVDESHAVDVVLEAGDVEVHHPNIVHGSDANNSPHRRAGLTIRYIPATTRILTNDPGGWPCAFLLRGQAVPGVNRYQPRPRFVEGVHLPFQGCEVWR